MRPARARARTAASLVALLALVVATMAPTVAAEPSRPDSPPRVPAARSVAAADGGPIVLRYAGLDRADTARLMAVDDTPLSARYDTATVLLARHDAFPDGLAAGYLSGLLGSPILLTAPDRLVPSAAAAVDELDPRTVIVLGGELAIGPAVVSALEGDDRHVVRIQGMTRYDTAAQIATYGLDRERHATLAIVASGANFPDALVASAISAAERVPLLLTLPDQLPDVTRDALIELGVTEVVVAGGPAAVATGVEAAINALGISTLRVSGQDRFQTAVEFAYWAYGRFGWASTHVNLTTGERFPDALALGAHAGHDAPGPSPIALTGTGSFPPITRAWFEDIADCANSVLHVAGGTAAVTDAVVAEAADALHPPGGCADAAPPTVGIEEPTPNELIRATDRRVRVSGWATDAETAILEAHVFVDGVYVGPAEVSNATDPARWTVDLFAADAGFHRIDVVVVDAAGNSWPTGVDVVVELPAPGEAVVAPETVILDDELPAIVSVGAGEIVFNRDPGLEPSQVVVAPVSATTPEGLLRVVVIVSQVGGQYVVITAPGSLTDALHQGSLSAEPSLGTDRTPRISTGSGTQSGVYVEEVCQPTATPPEPKPLVGQGLTFDKVIPLGANASVRLEGAVDVDADVRADLDIDWAELELKWGIWPKKIRLTPEVAGFLLAFDVNQDLALQMTAEYERTASKDLHVITLDFAPITFFVGPVPVVLVPQIKIDAGASGNLSATLTAAAEQKLFFTVGAEYRDGTWRNLSGVDTRFEAERPGVSFGASVDAQAYADLEFSIDLYDVVGPKMTVRPYLEFQAGTARTPTWELYAGLSGSVGMHVVVAGIELVDYTAPNIFDVRETLARSDTPTIAVTKPTPGAVVPAGHVPVTLAGCDGEYDKVEWWTDDTRFQGSGGREHFVHLTPGVHTIRADAFVDNVNVGSGTVTVTAVVDRTGQFQVFGQPTDALEFAREIARNPALVTSAVWAFEPWDVSLSSTAVRSMAQEVVSSPYPWGYGIDLPRYAEGSTVGLLSTGDVYLADDLDAWAEHEWGGVNTDHGDSLFDMTVLRIGLDVPAGDNCLAMDVRFFTEDYPEAFGNDAFLAEVDGSSFSMWSGTLDAPASFARDASGTPLSVGQVGIFYLRPEYAVETTFEAATPRFRISTPITPGTHTLHLTMLEEYDARADSVASIADLRTMQTTESSECPFGGVVVR